MKKLLFDLFPVILFFSVFKLASKYPEAAQASASSVGYLADEKQLPVLLATAVAIAATTVQIAWTKYRNGKVDVMLWVSFAIIAVFGGATLLLHDETFIKWKPTVLYWMFSAILLVSNVAFNKNLMKLLLQEKIALPLHAWNRLNLSWSLFFAVLGFINLYVAFNYSTDSWVNFKLFGFTGLMLVFILAQGAWLAKYVDEKKENN
jgi:intracellular septation protein